MNIRMLKTELYKIYSKRVIWIAMLVFLGLFLVLKLQFIENVGVKYTLEPMRSELSAAVENEDFHEFVRSKEYRCSFDEITQFIPQSVVDYIEQNKDYERAYNSLVVDLVSSVNNYFERIDLRATHIAELAEDVAKSDGSVLTKAKAKLLETYQNTEVTMELNLESSANNFIDINHAVVFPGLIMLVIVVGLAGIYSDEYTSGTQAALLTSRKGRRGVFLSKLCAAAIYVINVVLVMELFYMVVTAICYHAPNSTISAASTYGLYLTTYPGTVYGFCIRQILGTLLAGFTLGSIIMCLSALSKNALIPFFVAGAYYGGTALYANTITFPAYLSSLWSLPGELSLFMLQTQYELVAAGHYTSVFGLLVPTLTLNVILNAAIMVVCLLLCYRAYTRKQVKN